MSVTCHNMLKSQNRPRDGRNQTSLSIKLDTKNKLDFLLMHEKPRPLKMEELDFLIDQRIEALGLTEKSKKNRGHKKVEASR